VFDRVMHSANLGIILFDTLGQQISFLNREAADLFAGAVPETDYEALFKLLLPQGTPPVSPAYPAPLSLAGTLIGYTVYAEGPFVWVFLRDISEKARLEAVAEAVEAMNNIGYVFSTVRHEIGNPVNSIKTALTVLRNRIQTLSRANVLDYVERSLAELARVEDLLSTLKSFSMYEDFRIQEVEVAPFLTKLVALVSPEFEKKGIATRLNVHPGAQRGHFDQRALHQVLMNLLANAADALAGRPAPKIEIEAFDRPGLMCIRVKDDGCGMTESEVAQLFKPFVSHKPNGTGLGLVISKKMLAKMDGTIEIESTAGVGTVVTITLPEGEIEAA
jgi:signal transduction histidine kinase